MREVGILNRGDLSYVIRGIGLVKDLNDLGADCS